jgi:phosphatidylserine/phosphatidylglycerophosphate/cardiolipin synthase-like enzyme
MAELVLGQSTPLETELGIPGVPDALYLWRDAVQQATESIDIGAFYFMSKRNSRFNLLIDDISSAANRGVHVRIMLDKRFFEQDLKHGGDDHQKLIANLSAHKRIVVQPVEQFNKLGGMYHAKFFLIDGRILWLGSQNFDWRSLDHILEVGVLCTSQKLVGKAAALFEVDWHLGATRSKRRKVGGSAHDNVWFGNEIHRAELLASPKGYDLADIKLDIVAIRHAIRSSKNFVELQLSKYRSSFREMDHRWNDIEIELLEAASRGVELRILVDARTEDVNGQIDRLRELASHDNISVGIARISDHSSGKIAYARMVHSKFAVFDGRITWLGTSNWTPDDFFHSRNIGIIVEGRRFATTLHEIFEKLWTSEYVHFLSGD